jgi:hypothetical protein
VSHIGATGNPHSDAIMMPGFNHPHQRDFVTSDSPFLCLSGGFGSGKTTALVWRVRAMLIDTPYFGDMSGNIGLIGRFRRTDFEKTTLPELLKWIPQHWIKKHWHKDGKIELVNESVLHYMPLDSPDPLASLNIGFAAIDQMEEVSYEVWKVLAYERIRLRVLTRYEVIARGREIEKRLIVPQFDPQNGFCISTDPSERAAVLDYQCAFGVCNPRKGWIYDKFWRNEQYKDAGDAKAASLYKPNYKLIESSTFENRANLPAHYIENQRRDKSRRDYDRSVLGKWDAFEGQIYEDFGQHLVLNYNEVPNPAWPIYIGIDHGGTGTPPSNRATNITAVVFAALEERNMQYPILHIFDELDLPGSTIENTVAEIHDKLITIRMTQRYNFNMDRDAYPLDIPEDITWCCDPSMQKMRDKDGDVESIIGAYMRHAIARGLSMPLAPGSNDIIRGIERKNWLFRKQLAVFNPKCVNIIRNLESNEYGKNEKPAANQDDHHSDALTYLVSRIPLWWEYDTPDLSLVSRESAAIQQYHQNIAMNGTDPVFGARYL